MAGININQNIFNYGELDETRHGATDNELYNHGLAICKNVLVSDAGGLYAREGSVLVHYYTKRGIDGGYIGRYKRDLYSYNIPYNHVNNTIESGVLAIYPHGMELLGKHGIIAELQGIDWLTSNVLNKGYTIEQNEDALYMFCIAGIYEILYDVQQQELKITKLEFSVAPTGLINSNPNNNIRIVWIGGNFGLQVELRLNENGAHKFYYSDVGQQVNVLWSEEYKNSDNVDVKRQVSCWFRIDTYTDEYTCRATILIDKSNIIDSSDIEASLPQAVCVDYRLPVFGEERGGYPTKGCFFKGRMWIIDDANAVVYASHKSYDGTFVNFYMTNSEQDTLAQNESALMYSIDATTSVITWIKGVSDKIIIGTLDGMYISNGASVPKAGDLISFNTLDFVKFSSVSSGFTKPVQINSALIFTDYDGRTLYEVSVDNMTGLYSVFDLSQTSQHILRKGIAGSMSYSTYPFNLITMPLTDGTFAMMTYNRGNEIYGWTRHKLGGDNPCVESVANLHYGAQDYIFMCVSRVINGEIIRTIEYIENKSRSVVTEAEKYNYVDTSVRNEFVGEITDVVPARPATIEFDRQALRKLEPMEQLIVTGANDNVTTNTFCEIYKGTVWKGGLQKIIFSDDIYQDTFLHVPENVKIYSGQADPTQKFWLGGDIYNIEGDEDVQLYLVTDKVYTGSGVIVFESIYDVFANILPLRNMNVVSVIVEYSTFEKKDDGLYYYKLKYATDNTYITVSRQIFDEQELFKCKIAQYYISGKFSSGNNLMISYSLPSDKYRKRIYWQPYGVKLNYGSTKNVVSGDDHSFTFCTTRTRIIDNEILPAFVAGDPEDDNAITSKLNFKFFGAIDANTFIGLHKSGKQLVTVDDNDNVDMIEHFETNEPIQDVHVTDSDTYYVITRGLNNVCYVEYWDRQQDFISGPIILDVDDEIIQGHVIIHEKCYLTLKSIFFVNDNFELIQTMHPLGTKVRCAYKLNDRYIYVGGLDGYLYRLDTQELKWKKILLNNQMNFRCLQGFFKQNNSLLYCYSDTGDVLSLDLAVVVEETEDTITYQRNLIEIDGINQISFINNVTKDESVALVNNKLAESICGWDGERGFTNIVNKNDKIRVSDINFMGTLNKKPFLRVVDSLFSSIAGTGTIYIKRFEGDINLQERYDKGQAKNGKIYFAMNMVKGLSRFNGQRLRTVVDGKDCGNFVVQGDAIRFPEWYLKSKNAVGFSRYAGFPYEKEIKTLDLTGGSMKGSSVGLISRQFTLALRCYYSRGGEYSADGAVWYPIRYENISNKFLDIPNDLYSGILKMVMPNSSADVTSRELWLRHNTAEPFNILSITRDTYVSDN